MLHEILTHLQIKHPVFYVFLMLVLFSAGILALFTLAYFAQYLAN